jgi:hypothetical protein
MARPAKQTMRWIREAHYFDTNFDTVPRNNPFQAITLHPRSLGMTASKIPASGLGILGFGGQRNGGQGEN